MYDAGMWIPHTPHSLARFWRRRNWPFWRVTQPPPAAAAHGLQPPPWQSTGSTCVWRVASWWRFCLRLQLRARVQWVACPPGSTASPCTRDLSGADSWFGDCLQPQLHRRARSPSCLRCTGRVPPWAPMNEHAASARQQDTHLPETRCVCVGALPHRASACVLAAAADARASVRHHGLCACCALLLCVRGPVTGVCLLHCSGATM